jgi:hypothetical protein
MIRHLYCMDCHFDWPISEPPMEQPALTEFVKKHSKCHRCYSKKVVNYMAALALSAECA